MSERERWLWIDYAKAINHKIDRASSEEFKKDRRERARYFRPKKTDAVSTK